ncbi:sugar phosphate isomerase/epimerase family protein [Flavivirga aquimarina]|uniref:Sugar phosphate isomerase/epimerase family protein n=1 Tax=Flavivirga aquimarina TaxID=2027862 RepID=A0ABT8WB10_9FLAO|nr:sugar phosphate isomerase/epimerase family protein [Flavivirga aquimarina]MDO5970339.1 sugar phosphate isomerase/epimerase family protein [Flavivirga aquimarina]
MITRRDFIIKTACAASLLPFSAFPYQAFKRRRIEEDLDISIFSKHLQFLDYKTTGEMAAEMGFSGVDLTVRPKGHVLPELVKTDLPKAVREIKEGGSNCKMITTSIESVNNPLDVDIIKTAAKHGIKYYRTHWFKYLEGKTMSESINVYKQEIKNLSYLNKENNIIGYYQNHAGTNIGASFWEVKALLETADFNYFGTQYDIRHAVAEGGHSWVNGLKLLRPYIKGIVLKDFKWGKINGKWKAINVPIGEGMVNFDAYFKLLKLYGLRPPVSLHLEYNLGGAEKGLSNISVDKKVVFDAMRRDLSALQELWRNA